MDHVVKPCRVSSASRCGSEQVIVCQIQFQSAMSGRRPLICALSVLLSAGLRQNADAPSALQTSSKTAEPSFDLCEDALAKAIDFEAMSEDGKGKSESDSREGCIIGAIDCNVAFSARRPSRRLNLMKTPAWQHVPQPAPTNASMSQP